MIHADAHDEWMISLTSNDKFECHHCSSIHYPRSQFYNFHQSELVPHRTPRFLVKRGVRKFIRPTTDSRLSYPKLIISAFSILHSAQCRMHPRRMTEIGRDWPVALPRCLLGRCQHRRLAAEALAAGAGTRRNRLDMEWDLLLVAQVYPGPDASSYYPIRRCQNKTTLSSPKS